jgi:2-polyprenyl-3-methyl-5-hydroxy-6-metoxy-1,4-benzoquinol methylase
MKIKCKICNNKKIHKVLDLTNQPPANSLQKKINKQKKYPLILMFCKKCLTAQLSLVLNPKILFKKYFWVTSTSSTARKYSKFFYKKVSRYIKIKSKIIEIASNDGTFLLQFIKNGHDVLGVDPAINIAKEANKKGIKTIPKFFDYKLAKEIKLKIQNIDFVFARNVIPHVKNINSVIKGISELSNLNTIVAIEFHYSKNIITQLQYDSIYHEHIFYFTIKSITNLFKKFELKPFDVFESPISAGSLVIIFSKKQNKKSLKLKKLIKSEDKLKINTYAAWKKFANETIAHRDQFRQKINNLSKYNLFGYGASARSSTLLNFAGINYSHLKFIIDQNPLKQELFTPGTNIPIVSFDKVKKDIKNMKMVLLAWNFKNEIISFMRKKKFKNFIYVPFCNK